MRQDQIDHAKLLRGAFEEYLSYYHQHHLEPTEKLLTYHFEFIEDRKWAVMGGRMICGDLCELTNRINGWADYLCRWHAWSRAIEGHDEIDAWTLRKEFLDSMAHQCLMLPASIRDVFTFVATEVFHQVRLNTDNTYSDYLEGDPKTPDEKPRYLSRRAKEKRLSRLISIWPESNAFLGALYELNTEEYRIQTRDYRNLATHSIGPRLGIGETRFVTRAVEQAIEFVRVDSGGIEEKTVPNKMSVVYTIGGNQPLDLEDARAANLKEYQKARRCYIELMKLLKHVVTFLESVDN